MRREARDATVRAWQAANFDGMKPEKLRQLLGEMGGEAQPQRQASVEQTMTAMAQWRVAALELEARKKAGR